MEECRRRKKRGEEEDKAQEGDSQSKIQNRQAYNNLIKHIKQ